MPNNRNHFIDEKYAQICSEKTLQTNQEGFFLAFADQAAAFAGENWVKKVFGGLKNDCERIRSVYRDERISEFVIEFLSRVQEIYRTKSVEVAEKRRVEADKCVEKGELLKALSLYNQSVIKSVKTGETWIKSILARSELLIKLQEFSKALSSLQTCLKEKISDKVKSNVFLQIAICHSNLGDEIKAKISLALAQKLSPDASKNIPKNNPIKTVTVGENAKILAEIPLGNRHPKLKYASRKLSVKNSKELGKYVVAKEEIKTGETLVVEPAYSACLLPEKFGTHCQNCFERLLAPIGCPDCSSLAFCQSECRDLAVSTYHRHECKFLDLLIGSGMSVLSHTALRMITQNTLEQSLEIHRNRKENSAYNLCTNSHKRSPGDFLQRTLMAAFLLRILQKCGYFGQGDMDRVVPTEQEYQIGELLLYHLQMLQFNAHEIYETLYAKEHRFKGSRPAYIGVAVYPTVALFNHDCYPSVTRYFVGKQIVITAVRPLRPTDIIAENYGPIFTWRKLEHRQRTLSSRYWFNCRCTACLEDWPTLNEISSDSGSAGRRVRCPNKACENLFSLPLKTPVVKCPTCGNLVSLEENINQLKWCEEQFELALKLLDQQEKKALIEIVCSALDVFHRVSSAPHADAHLAQEALRTCLADSGNRHLCNQKLVVI